MSVLAALPQVLYDERSIVYPRPECFGHEVFQPGELAAVRADELRGADEGAGDVEGVEVHREKRRETGGLVFGQGPVESARRVGDGRDGRRNWSVGSIS
jgi:hypothetical protein